MIYRDGTDEEASKFQIKYVPTLVIADQAGTQLKRYEADQLLQMHEAGTLANDVCAAAASFK